MAQPSPGDMHVSTPLTNMSVAWMQTENEFIATKVFPNLPVAKQSDKYYVHNRDAWTRTDAQLRAPATESAGSGWDLSQDTYYADVWAIHKDNADQDYANVDAAFNLDAEASEFTTRQVRLRQELQFLSTFMVANAWTGDQTGVPSAPTGVQFIQWDLANSTPVADIKESIRIITRRSGGFRPNTLVLGPAVYDVLTEHATILARIQYSERAIVGTDLLASLFGVDRVLVPYPVQNTSPEGAAMTLDFMYSRAALLVYAAPRPGIRTPSGGYTFSWNGYLGASAMGTRVKRFRMEEIASWRIECEAAFDMKVVDPAAGTLFIDAVSTAAA